MSAIKKTVAAGLAALTLGTATLASTTPASAWWRRGGWGAPVAAGVIGGLAAGAILGGVARGVYGPAYAYGPGPNGCVRRRPVYDAYGYFAGYRPVRVC